MLHGWRNRTSLERYFPESRIFAVFVLLTYFSHYSLNHIYHPGIRGGAVTKAEFSGRFNLPTYSLRSCTVCVRPQRSMPAVPLIKSYF
ncbi:hypothetical protein PR1_88 [Providencia phage vB_PreS_PR1]|uniref:Uncharacterized protein n=1 Tax=Providencia phage vB_PreS_PR1 TaxID=1931407 RepID=A0A1S6KV90_9CAUD|nr:hypothetical protein FDH30_gp127 [Providencia phage vB_PreS_PR1]AQT25331.1 hypothetical protein PR1_88 [Providencia phage vB_PreS_PR1]